jgi:hypothetical protein
VYGCTCFAARPDGVQLSAALQQACTCLKSAKLIVYCMMCCVVLLSRGGTVLEWKDTGRSGHSFVKGAAAAATSVAAQVTTLYREVVHTAVH